LTHTGALARNAGYDVPTSIRIPRELDSGLWYLTAWADPFDVVPEDQLAVNNNPDDPNQVDTNTSKARPITIIGALPDLVVTDIVAPATAVGGTMFTVRWTVQNRGTAAAEPGGWGDRVYLSDRPNPKEQGAHALYLGQVKHEGPLAIDETYSGSLPVQLSPSAGGRYIVVLADDSVSDRPGISLPGLLPPPPPGEQFTPVKEASETNNARAEGIDVTPVPANLVVTHVEVPQVNYSGESITF